MVSEKELEKGLIYRGKNPHCTYCGKRLRLFEIKVKTGTDWEVRCGKCGLRPPEPSSYSSHGSRQKKAVINWGNMSGKQILLAHFIVFVILLMIFAS